MSIDHKKMDPKSCPCVFIGYSMKHKGYKCLYPPTGRFCISRHVVFHESIFPYSMPTSLYKNDSLERELCTFSEWKIDPSSDPAHSLTPLSASASPGPQNSTNQNDHQIRASFLPPESLNRAHTLFFSFRFNES